ncbi:MAG: helix-turn-helix domain-containing protein [Ignavibacteria bacterium]|nr:helix-turn-helix domain-containing protein [Ignavibacteria bacterium]
MRLNKKTKEKILELRKKGHTYTDIAKMLGIGRATLYQWFAKDKKLKKMLDDITSELNDNVEMSLYKRAMGYTIEEAEFRNENGQFVVVSKKTKHIPSDTTACIFWLKNQAREKWQDVFKHDINSDIFEKMKKIFEEKING